MNKVCIGSSLKHRECFPNGLKSTGTVSSVSVTTSRIIVLHFRTGEN